MIVYEMKISNKALTNFALPDSDNQLKILNLRGFSMRHSLPKTPQKHYKCGIVNFHICKQPGSQWICYYRKRND